MILFYWIVEFIATLIESIMCFTFSGIFIKKNNDGGIKKKAICYALVTTIIVIVTNHVELFSVVNGVVGVALLLFFQMVLHKKQYKFIVLLTIIYTVIVTTLDFSASQIGAIVLGVDIKYILQVQCLDRCVCTIMSKLLLIIIITLIKKYTVSEIFLPKKYIVGICSVSLTLIVLDYYIVENGFKNTDVHIRDLLIIFIGLSIVVVTLFFVFILKLAENYKQKQEMAILEFQNNTIYKSEKNNEKLFNLWKSSIHDYKHKIFALKHWLDENNIDAINDFVSKENKMLNQKAFYIKTGNSLVDAIINTKRNLAEEMGITFSTNILFPKNCIINDIDLVGILGNLIDNAIEACEAQSTKYVDVVIKEVKDTMLMIKIVNGYEGKLKVEEGTTKSDRELHGIGLKNVKKIVEKYKGVFEVVQDQKEVSATIIIMNR